MNILLHTCCGPCALYPLRTMRAAGHDVTGFFYNHNIHPYQEYCKRRDAVVEMAEQETMPLIMRDEYDLEVFLASVADAPENRCSYCYSSRLRATAKVAAEGGFDAFSAALLYSRYQKHEEIRALGEQIGQEFGVAFHYEDFRSGWQEGIKLSKELGLYRQQYCGCIYSEKDRYLPKGQGTRVKGQGSRDKGKSNHEPVWQTAHHHGINFGSRRAGAYLFPEISLLARPPAGRHQHQT